MKYVLLAFILIGCQRSEWQESCLERGICQFREWQFCFHNCFKYGINKYGERVCLKRDLCFEETCEKWENVSENDLYRFERAENLNPELDTMR